MAIGGVVVRRAGVREHGSHIVFCLHAEEGNTFTGFSRDRLVFRDWRRDGERSVCVCVCGTTDVFDTNLPSSEHPTLSRNLCRSLDGRVFLLGISLFGSICKAVIYRDGVEHFHCSSRVCVCVWEVGVGVNLDSVLENGA